MEKVAAIIGGGVIGAGSGIGGGAGALTDTHIIFYSPL